MSKVLVPTAFIIIAVLGSYFLYSLWKYGFGGTRLLRVALDRNRNYWRELAGENLPLGVLVVDENGRIIWNNSYLSRLVGKNILLGMDLARLFPGFSVREQSSKEQSEVYHWSKKVFYIKSVLVPVNSRTFLVMTCEDITQNPLIYRRGQETQPVLGFIQADNLGEVLKSLPEESKPHLLSGIEKTLSQWVQSLDGYLKLIGEGKYLLILSQWGLKQAEKTRFTILDRIREIEVAKAMPLTVSIGLGLQDESIGEIASLAQNALELALDRGGDQVVVKDPDHVRFYGGKSSTIDKRTKVKARVTAYALRDLILQSSQVMIMGHDLADYDSLGASFGLAKAVRDLGGKALILLDQYNPATDRLLELLPIESGAAALLQAREAGRKINGSTLLIIVDTHKPSLLANSSLLEKAQNIAVIDHHRRGEEFIPNPKLVYLEPHASSASELVTELLQYLGDEVEISRHEATALLAGITIDTKYFMFQTGVRTFEAASYLRGRGADPITVQKLLQDDIATVIRKVEVIRNSRVLFGQIALGESREENPEAQLLAAKTADTMLNIAGVNAAFVLWAYQEGVAISARSNGQINVQAIMERLGGGGHFTIAAAQLNEELPEAKEKLLTILEEMFTEEVQR